MHPLVGLQLSGNVLTPLDDSAIGHLGRPIWDPWRLLDDLQLRLGLPKPAVSHGMRVQQWSKRLSNLIGRSAGTAPFFAAAYREDPTGTAAQLLRLRDELVDAGWNGEALTGPERLGTLWGLSQTTDPPLVAGRADQLATVEAELRRTSSTPYTALDLVEAQELWSGRWRRVFDRLAQLGTRFGVVQPVWAKASGESDLTRFQRALRRGKPDETRPLAGDGSLVLLRGATSSVLAEPVAALLATDLAPSTVVVRGGDPGPLDAALARQGLARQGTLESSRWPPRFRYCGSRFPSPSSRVIRIACSSFCPSRRVLSPGERDARSRRLCASGRAWAIPSGGRQKKSSRTNREGAWKSGWSRQASR